MEKQAKNDQEFLEQFLLVWVTKKLILFLYLNKTDNNLLVHLVDNLLRFFLWFLFLDFVCVERSSKIYRRDGSSFAIYTTSSEKGFVNVKFITGSFSTWKQVNKDTSSHDPTKRGKRTTLLLTRQKRLANTSKCNVLGKVKSTLKVLQFAVNTF